MVITFSIIMTVAYILVLSVPAPEMQPDLGGEQTIRMQQLEARGRNDPIMTQYVRWLRNIFPHRVTEFVLDVNGQQIPILSDGGYQLHDASGTPLYETTRSWNAWDWGISDLRGQRPVIEVVAPHIPFTVVLNLYSLMIAMPIGIALGIWAAVKKNKLTDHIISTAVMIFISVPMFIFGIFIQYTLGFRLTASLGLPLQVASLAEAGGFWTWTMFRSMIMPITAMCFGTIAGMTRMLRAELTEALTSEYMLLARAKGLTKNRAIRTHALKNAMVPIIPGILASFIGVLGGSVVIEQIFSVPGMGRLFLNAFQGFGQGPDTDLYLFMLAFYIVIGLVAQIITDLSFGFIDPRIRMGQR
ncbi:MAG: ABC transporter permease [Defluviitaleaceae bacterium]|nr:ABC transporter permease [Defluviitaleaceae bacterium]